MPKTINDAMYTVITSREHVMLLHSFINDKKKIECQFSGISKQMITNKKKLPSPIKPFKAS